MKIRSIAASAFQLPNRRSFKWAGLNGELGSFVLVRIETDSGHVGYGEATPLPDWGGDHGRRSGETLASVSHLVNEVFAPLLSGTDPTAVQAARLLMDRAVVGNTYAKCAVDIALHDLWGKVVGLPVYRLLGGAVRADVEFAHMVGLLPDDHALEEAVAAVTDGVGALQIKGGVDPARDVRLVRALRGAVGDGIRLRVDANQGYGHPKHAAAIVRRLEEAGATCVEQPTEGLAAMAEVTAAARIPVIADESCWTLHDAMELTQARGADCISIYLAKAGGFAPARAVADVAAARAMACDVNGSIESAIGNAANLHFALSHPAVTLASVIPVSAPAGRHPYRVAGRYYEDDVIREPFAVRGGRLLPLEAPGLGIDVDEAALARFRRR